MKIIANNTIKLEEVYKSLKRDGKEIELNEVSIEGAMGLEVELIINADIILNIDLLDFIADMFKNYLEYRLIKSVLIENKSKSEEVESEKIEVIDVEVLTDKEKLKELNINSDSILEIEYKER